VRFHSVEKFELFKSPVQRVSEQRLNGLAAGHPVKTERASPPATAVPLVHPVPAWTGYERASLPALNELSRETIDFLNKTASSANKPYPTILPKVIVESGFV